MNRPFYAFGMLLALLVLTTLAVSSSTRSTTVKRVKPRAERSLPFKRRPGGAVFVVVLPAKQRAASQITPARVELAGPVSLPTIHEPRDRRSADAAYDVAGYGTLPEVQPGMTPPAAAIPGKLATEEIVNVFTSFSRVSHSRQSDISKTIGGWTPWILRPLALGLQNWIGRQVDRLPLVWLWKQLLADKAVSSAPVSWNDYADLINEAAPLATAPRATTIQFVSDGLVRSGDGLLHSAALSLHRLALLFELAAERLQQPRTLVKADQADGDDAAR